MTPDRLTVWKIRFLVAGTLAMLAIVAVVGLVLLPSLSEPNSAGAAVVDDADTDDGAGETPQPAPAIDAGHKIAVVNLEKIKDSYQKYIDSDKRISEREKQLQDELEKFRAPLEEIKKQRDARPRNTDAWFDLDKKLKDKASELEAAVKKAQAEINRKDLNLMEDIIGDITAAIGKCAKAEGIEIVLWKKQVILNQASLQQRTAYLELISVLYADPRLDITEDVITQLNTAYEKEN